MQESTWGPTLGPTLGLHRGAVPGPTLGPPMQCICAVRMSPVQCDAVTCRVGVGPLHSPTAAECTAVELPLAPPPPSPRQALEGKGPQGRPQRRLDRRLEEVDQAVVGGYCWLQMPLKHLPSGRQWLGVGRAPWRGEGPPPPSLQCIPCPSPPFVHHPPPSSRRRRSRSCGGRSTAGCRWASRRSSS